jgi:hypothetical protein
MKTHVFRIFAVSFFAFVGFVGCSQDSTRNMSMASFATLGDQSGAAPESGAAAGSDQSTQSGQGSDSSSAQGSSSASGSASSSDSVMASQSSSDQQQTTQDPSSSPTPSSQPVASNDNQEMPNTSPVPSNPPVTSNDDQGMPSTSPVPSNPPVDNKPCDNKDPQQSPVVDTSPVQDPQSGSGGAIIATRREGPAKFTQIRIVLKEVSADLPAAERKILVDIGAIKDALRTGYGNITIKQVQYDDANHNGKLDAGERITSEKVLVPRGSLFISNKIEALLQF